MASGRGMPSLCISRALSGAATPSCRKSPMGSSMNASATYFDDYVRRFTQKVWPHRPVARFVDRFDEIHEIPVRRDGVARDRRRVGARRSGLLHVERLILLELGKVPKSHA